MGFAFLRPAEDFAKHLPPVTALESVGLTGLLTGIALLLVLVEPFGLVRAQAPITVTTATDELNSDGDCSLREAILAADTDSAVDACPAGSGDDTISIPAGVYTLTLGTIVPCCSRLTISTNLNLIGAGAADTIIQAADSPRVAGFRVFRILGLDVTISGVTIRHGSLVEGVGGGILTGSFNSLTLIDSVVSDNSAGSNGGGISNLNGTLTVIDTTISDNSSSSGGGIRNSPLGNLTLTDSTVSDNTAGFTGGGIWNNGTLTVTNSTVSGNDAAFGGGVSNGFGGGTATLTASTITANSAAPGGTGGGIFIDSGVLSVKGTLVANSPSGGDCSGSVTSLGHNLDDDGTCSLTVPTDLPNRAPSLGPLQNNGGPTLTHALLPGSPAIDAVGVADCTDPSGDPISTDQRGVSRPQGSACDIGAFEVVPDADVGVTKADSPDPVLAGNSLAYTVTVTNNGPSDATSVTITDTLPDGVTFVSATPVQGSCSQSADTVTCNLGSLSTGLTTKVTIAVIPGAPGLISNTASVTSSENDPNSSNDVATQNTTVSPADVAISKADSPDPSFIGQPLSYVLTIMNRGPATSTALTLIDVLPGSMTFLSVTASQGSCSESGGTVTCSLGNLAAGRIASSTVVVTPTAPGRIGNTARVGGSEPDPDPGNNAATQVTTVNPADLMISKRADSTAFSVGMPLAYTLTVTNNGPSTSTSITLTDALPESITLVSATSSQGSCSESGGAITCSLGDLVSGEVATSTIIVIPRQAEMRITNIASVMGTEPDPNPSNNKAIEVTLGPLPIPNASNWGLIALATLVGSLLTWRLRSRTGRRSA